MTTEVTVTPEPDVPDNDDTVVVAPVIVNDSGSDDNNDTDIALVVGELVAKVDALTERIDAVQATAVVAESTAETALDIAVSEPEPEPIVEEVEPDNPPHHVPWTHRTNPFSRDN